MNSTIGGDADVDDDDQNEVEIDGDPKGLTASGGGLDRIKVRGDSLARWVREFFWRFRNRIPELPDKDGVPVDRCRLVSFIEDIATEFLG